LLFEDAAADGRIAQIPVIAGRDPTPLFNNTLLGRVRLPDRDAA
jgi:hypothetical protein